MSEPAPIAPADVAARAPFTADYRRREPEQSLLYQLVAAEAPGLRQALAAGDDDSAGAGVSRHVSKELAAFLDCGLLDRGFGRVYCHRCRAEHLVA